MSKAIDNQPLTIKDIREVLIPAMEEVFATKKDLENFVTKDDALNFATKADLENFATKDDINLVMNALDKTLKKIEDLIQENTMQFSQNRRFLDKLENHEKRITNLEQHAFS